MKKKVRQLKNKIPYNFIYSKEKPMAYITEAYQKAVAGLEHINIDKKIKIIQTTSSMPAEGKTTFQSNIAFLLSKKGYKTILVDLDLRRPKVHEIYSVENTKGVTEVLSGKTKLEDAIKSNKKNGFDILTSGEKTYAIASILESKKIKDLLDILREKYDYILLDSPPILSVSDSLYISKLSDAVIFVVSREDSKKSFVKEAIKVLKRNNVNLIGAVITKNNNNKRGNYYYDYEYGYGYY
jgi:capsular exopolysaccharide synthesis family protein